MYFVRFLLIVAYLFLVYSKLNRAIKFSEKLKKLPGKLMSIFDVICHYLHNYCVLPKHCTVRLLRMNA